MTSSGQSKKITRSQGLIISSKRSAWSWARGKPSIRKSRAPLFTIAVRSSPMITCGGGGGSRTVKGLVCVALVPAQGAKHPTAATAPHSCDRTPQLQRKAPQHSCWRSAPHPAPCPGPRTSMGTSLPSFMICSHSCPSAEPLLTSSRSRSPAERWVKPYLSTILAHCVPLPLPGPPSTNTMRRSSGSSSCGRAGLPSSARACATATAARSARVAS